jgi:hypothetical protein
MTPRDDTNLQLLERDLHGLAAPQESDERIRLAIRRQLAQQVRPKPVRRPGRIAFAAAALVGALAAVTLVALAASAGPGGPTSADAAILHRTIRAITPPANSILHVKVVGVQNGTAIMGETWQETSPPYASRGMKGTAGHPGEFADNGTTSFFYDPSTDTIDTQPDTSRPTFTDPISQVRQALANGQAQLAGTTTIGGESLIKIDLKGGLVGYFDAHDYHPRYLDDPQRGGSIVQLRVVIYEYLPLTSSTRAMLNITALHPSARIVTAPSTTSAK